jgi:hypothetical protein
MVIGGVIERKIRIGISSPYLAQQEISKRPLSTCSRVQPFSQSRRVTFFIPIVVVSIMSSESDTVPELKKQNEKFGYKAPESVYPKHDPKASLTGQGKAFTGVSPSTSRRSIPYT